MRRYMVLAIVVCMIGTFAVAAGHRVKVDKPANAGNPPAGGEALQWIDYWPAAGVSFYYWTDTMYISNLFKPQGTWYPLDVVALEVLASSLDDQTTTSAAGVLNGVAVFDPAGTVLARELNVNAQVDLWTLVNLTSPPRINAGNFYAGMWNSAASSADRNDGGLQGTAENWIGPPDEPFECMSAGTTATANGAGPWLPNGCGGSWPTTSAASVRAQIDSNVPVELMRFEAD